MLELLSEPATMPAVPLEAHMPRGPSLLTGDDRDLDARRTERFQILGRGTVVGNDLVDRRNLAERAEARMR